jgi:small-conductance mechanosensitive channel
MGISPSVFLTAFIIINMQSLQDLIHNEYIVFGIITIASALIASAIYFILTRYLKKVTRHTTNDIDDQILDVVSKPAFYLLFLAGFYFAVNSLTLSDKYTLWVDRAFVIVYFSIGAFVISRVLTIFINQWLKVEKQYAQTPKLINKAVSIIVYILAFLMVLNYFKIEITPLIATLGVGGIAIGLALQSTLSNLFAGIQILSDNPFTVGDFVSLIGTDIEGYITDIGWRTTRLRTLPNTIVVVPNAKISESIIINNYRPELEMSALVQCGVAYDSDLEKVERVTIDVARKTLKTVQGAVSDFDPFIRYHTFADSNINFSIILRVKEYTDKYLLTHEFIKALTKRYNEENIEISWPVRKVYKGN